MTPPRAVVTGGAGFVGSHLCDRLLAEGWEVVCVDSLLTGKTENLSAALASARFSLHEADITQGLPVSGSVDWVFHFASPASPRDYLEHPIATNPVASFVDWLTDTVDRLPSWGAARKSLAERTNQR